MDGIAVLAWLTLGVASLVAAVALVRTGELRRRIDHLEHRLDTLRREASGVRPAAPAPAPASVPPPAVDDPAPDRWHAAAQHRAQEVDPSEPDWFDQQVQRVWRWFTEGNVPVKVGVVVLFAGVGALLKFAASQGWMDFPIELRLAGITAAALAALVFGWRQRTVRRTFALGMQGGAIGVLLMTSFAAWKLYGLMGPGPAFVLWVLLAAAAGLLALWQEARALAVLGILAGFMAPILMSTGGGSHVTVFSFYAVLNAAIFGIAWKRSWRELNLLGFLFTFGIGTWWGVLRYRPEHLANTLPFLLLFFVFYLLIPVLHARRGDPLQRDPVDAGLVFGTPLVCFAMLAGLLEGDRSQLAVSALGVAVLYAGLAWTRAAGTAPLLRQAHAVLAVGFATLSVPLALSASATASVFALEGAALVWFGLVQQRRLPLWAGAALQVLAAASHLHGSAGFESAWPVINGGFMGALLLAGAGFASAWLHARAGEARGQLVYYLWGLAWWLVMGHHEISQFVPHAMRADFQLAFAAVTAAAAALAAGPLRSAAPGWTVVACLAAAIPLTLAQTMQHQHPFGGQGLAAWSVHAVLGALALWLLRTGPGRHLAWSHGAWLLTWPLAVMLWLQHAVAGVGTGWQDAAMALPWLLGGAGLRWWPGLAAWPLARQFEAWHEPVLALWQTIVAAACLLLALQPGAIAPLPYFPVLNPLDLSLLSGLAMLALWRRPLPAAWLAVMAFGGLTSITLRGVHHLGDLPWNAALFDTALAQAGLSLAWSVLGVAGWTAGSRRRQRDLWLAGAIMMGVVLVKLVLVDRAHLGNLAGIASFIGYGLLCMVVGYLAPAPPRRSDP